MDLKRASFRIEGMTCPACEARIGAALRALPGVLRAEVRLRGGRAEVEYEGGLASEAELEGAIRSAGYSLRRGGGGGLLAPAIGLLLGAAYLLASASGLFDALPAVDASLGYAMLFVAGLLTSVHCVAMCGGLAISQSLGGLAAQGEGGRARLGRLRPGLLYNGGRVLSYTLIGALAGALGSALSFSPLARALLMGLAGAFMLLFGLRSLGLLPGLPRLGRLLPAGLRRGLESLGSALRNRGPLALGLLNGLMPCGPLQTMQLYALGTGSALAGAISMLLFSLGTVPLMLGLGLGAALLPRRLLPGLVRASAVLVMILGLASLGRAASLAGFALPGLSALSPEASALSPGSSAGGGIPGRLAGGRAGLPAGLLRAELGEGVQSVTTVFKDGYYLPFAVQAGIPLRWTIRIAEEDINGCNNPLVVPAYGIEKTLIPGDNLIEFTPNKAGTIAYSCWMGMIRSRITVVESLGSVPEAVLGAASSVPGASPPEASGPLGQAGLLCASGALDPAFAGGRIPVGEIGLPVIEKGVQTVTIEVREDGYFPAAILLEKGKRAVIRFKATALNGCNSPVIFPEYNGALDLARGQLETPPLEVGEDFGFRCWMGMINGYVKVVEDLDKANLEKIRAEIGAIRGAGGGASCSALPPAASQ